MREGIVELSQRKATFGDLGLRKVLGSLPGPPQTGIGDAFKGQKFKVTFGYRVNLNAA